MTKKYKILAEFAKDVSYETPDIETYLQTKDNILKYHLTLEINSKFLKNKMTEVNIISKFQETNLEKKKSNFEITYAAIVRIDENVKNEKEMKQIVLSDVPNEIYPRLEDLFITLVNKSGFQKLKLKEKLILKSYIKKNLIN